MKKYITHTADDEKPSCGRCDRTGCVDKWCMENCGGANSWKGYKRTELEKEKSITKVEELILFNQMMIMDALVAMLKHEPDDSFFAQRRNMERYYNTTAQFIVKNRRDEHDGE